MRKLVVIERHGDGELTLYFEDVNAEVTGFNPDRVPDNVHKTARNIMFFSVPDKKVAAFVEYAAKQNPGCEVQVYTLEKVGQCPAGDYVMKDVTKDGVLPT